LYPKGWVGSRAGAAESTPVRRPVRYTFP